MNIIRKIVVGINPKDAMVFFVGMRAGGGEVVDIRESDGISGSVSYEVWIEADDSSYIWKKIQGLPVLIEYDCHF